MSKSIRKTPKTERQWILEQDGYTIKSQSFKFKSRIVTRTVKDENGQSVELKEKVVSIGANVFYKREYHEHKSFLTLWKITPAPPCGIPCDRNTVTIAEKFFKKEFVHKTTGEVIDADSLLGMLDEEKLEDLTAFMG